MYCICGNTFVVDIVGQFARAEKAGQLTYKLPYIFKRKNI